LKVVSALQDQGWGEVCKREKPHPNPYDDMNVASIRACFAAEGYESLSEIRLSAKKRNALSLMLGDTRLREDDEADLASSFLHRVQDISGQLPSNRCALRSAAGCHATFWS
jgi:hypothetical protein